MVIIADNRIPDQAKGRLEKLGEVIYLYTSGITYDAISCHPDIFFCQLSTNLILAPNTPDDIIRKLTEKTFSFAIGDSMVGERYPQTSFYNAVVTNKFIIHNHNFTDIKIKELTADKEFIHVNQAYTRCNLIALNNNRFITSDRGIEKILVKTGFEVLFVDPAGILLPGFKHGFIGGACGVSDYKIVFAGGLDYFPEGKKIHSFLSDYEIIELYDGPLFDGGSLIFIP